MAKRIKDIAAALGVAPLGDAELEVVRLAEPASAGTSDLALAMTPAYSDALARSKARAAIVWPGAAWKALGLEAAIPVPRARLAMAQLTQSFDQRPAMIGLHKTAVIDASAMVSENSSVGALTVIGKDVAVDPDTWIGSQVSIADGVRIGRNCQIHPGVRIGRNVRIGDGVILHPGVVIGADGFSFVTATPSNEERAVLSAGRAPLSPHEDATRHRIHSLGSVVIEAQVEIGANSTVDAGTIRATRIGAGTKIDNLVQVGHNVTIGRDCVLCAQAAVAGSARLGDRVVMGGKSGIRDNVTIGQDVVLGGGAIVLSDVADGMFMMGYPAAPMPEHRAGLRALRNLIRK